MSRPSKSGYGSGYASDTSASSSSGKKGSFSSSFRSENTVMMGSDDCPPGLGHGSEAFAERFETLEEVTRAIREEGIEQCSLIFGIDYTMSNRMQGAISFDGRSLHETKEAKANPYQQVICILGETLEPFHADDTLPAFGFGDKVTKGDGIFPLKADGECEDFSEVLDVYDEITPTIKLSGPTNFVPLIEKAVEIVKEKRTFHVLVIVADGQVTDEEANIKAIVEASQYPLSIVMIGVGDGPWDVMKDFDKKLKGRRFDNFRFVDFHNTSKKARNPQAAIALSALMLIPDQYQTAKKLGLLQQRPGGRK